MSSISRTQSQAQAPTPQQQNDLDKIQSDTDDLELNVAKGDMGQANQNVSTVNGDFGQAQQDGVAQDTLKTVGASTRANVGEGFYAGAVKEGKIQANDPQAASNLRNAFDTYCAAQNKDATDPSVWGDFCHDQGAILQGAGLSQGQVSTMLQTAGAASSTQQAIGQQSPAQAQQQNDADKTEADLDDLELARANGDQNGIAQGTQTVNGDLSQAQSDGMPQQQLQALTTQAQGIWGEGSVAAGVKSGQVNANDPRAASNLQNAFQAYCQVYGKDATDPSNWGQFAQTQSAVMQKAGVGQDQINQLLTAAQPGGGGGGSSSGG